MIEAKSLRLAVLEREKRMRRYGLQYEYGQTGATDVPSLLRTLARDGPRTLDEKIFLEQLLLALAEGRDVRDELNLRVKRGHRTHDPLVWRTAEAVDALVASGTRPADAYRAVAKGNTRTALTVKKNYERWKKWRAETMARMVAVEQERVKRGENS